MLRDGINLCIDLNLTNVIIELDAKLVVDLLQNEDGRIMAMKLSSLTVERVLRKFQQ